MPPKSVLSHMDLFLGLHDRRDITAHHGRRPSDPSETFLNVLRNFPGKAGELLEGRWGDLKLMARFWSYRHLSEP